MSYQENKIRIVDLDLLCEQCLIKEGGRETEVGNMEAELGLNKTATNKK